jgi:hypothetical protein
MFRRLLLAVAVLTSSAAMAQEPDSIGFSKRPDVRFGGLTMRMARAVADPTGNVARADANLSGVEFVAKEHGGAGIQLRYASAEVAGAATSIASGKLEYVDGKLIIGGRAFAFTTGYRLRTFRYPLTERRMHYAHGGVQAGYRFDGAGVELMVAGSYFRSIKKGAVDSLETAGFEGESMIMYTVPRLPLYATLGYRRELFDLKRGTSFPRREELGGLLLGIGVQTGLGTR